MPIERLNIEQFLQLATNHLILDVRSPAEFNHAHIPGAYSVPLFSDDERKVVGTAYKQQSREQAIKVGLDFFGPNMRKIVEHVESLVNNHSNTNKDNAKKHVLVHCWRGGMRSAGIAWLLDLYGFKVSTLVGGYKNYRQRIVQSFSYKYNFKILGGYTGSGKTYVIEELAKLDATVINLEQLANHKGSAFGNIGMPSQPSQEMFENFLGEELIKYSVTRSIITEAAPVDLSAEPKCIWIEDESQRIGLINLPVPFWKQMRESRIFFLDIPFEKRVDHITDEYGKLDQQRMEDAIIRIQKRLGGLETKTALQHLREGDIRSCFSILLKYYDKWYSKGLANRDGLDQLLVTIPVDEVCASANAKKILAQQ
ncbi:MAG: tRNA 2-selenouridine(34) synthase MnmH [Chitinophagaceae bacterium]|nr:tRNA 2-selenouridine(34) synthase MnmH [Chitinophagaceae bacterium]